MKSTLVSIVAAVVLVGCGPSVDIWTGAQTGNIEAVKQHLDGGADVNAGNEGGFTPLHYAAIEGHKEIAELLIAKGADVNAKAVDGETPLDRATMPDSQFNTTETADLLRKHGGKTFRELRELRSR